MYANVAHKTRRSIYVNNSSEVSMTIFKKKKKKNCNAIPPPGGIPVLAVNVTPTEQTGGAAYPEANLNTKSVEK